MATIYEPKDVTLFGPLENTILNIDEESEEDIDSFTRHFWFLEYPVTEELQRCWVRLSNDSKLILARLTEPIWLGPKCLRR